MMPAVASFQKDSTDGKDSYNYSQINTGSNAVYSFHSKQGCDLDVPNKFVITRGSEVCFLFLGVRVGTGATYAHS